MSFKIKHENSINLMVGLFSILIAFLVLFAFPKETFSLFVWLIGMNISGICAIFYFIEQAVGTTVVVEDRTIIIKCLLRRRKITVQDICNINAEKYKRYRKGNKYRRGYTEHRMRMTIELLSGKKIVLTDKATAVRNEGLFGSAQYEEIPDEEVSLYKAYMAIRQRCIKYNGWQIAETPESDLPIR
ncbi:MAG: hypothetical protein J6A41_03385 [Ruminiclostridium sp.]|nr:hypothetical protein [Ruminiclostridium sp.]